MLRASVVLLLLCAAPASAGELRGRVRYQGKAKPAGTLPVARDNKVCGQSQPDESLVVGASGGVKNAVAYLKDAPPGPTRPSRSHTLDQQSCRYLPHVTAAQVGDTLLALNSDSLLHNVRGTRPDGRTPFNVAMPLKGMKRSFPLSDAGLIIAGCDAGHTWMKAYVHVFPHPYFAVTDENGSFTLPDVPPGSYTLVLWHEKLGEQSKPVKVTAEGATVQLELK